MDVNVLVHHGILGQKWGVRRYQNADGSLTEAGRQRYDRDQRENAAKKKENRINVSEPDPKRWAKEDLERSKKVVDASSDFVKQAQSLEKNARMKKIDLSHMTDKEMRDQINRVLLEQQYTKLFADTTPSAKGREFLKEALSATGVGLATISSILGIALAIKQLKG